MKIIKNVYGKNLRLTKTRISEQRRCHYCRVDRAHLNHVLKSGGSSVKGVFKASDKCLYRTHPETWSVGIGARGLLRIGCHLFDRKTSATILRWAKGAK